MGRACSRGRSCASFSGGSKEENHTNIVVFKISLILYNKAYSEIQFYLNLQQARLVNFAVFDWASKRESVVVRRPCLLQGFGIPQASSFDFDSLHLLLCNRNIQPVILRM
jgi:hypothetical protein